jgi:hypothetical protein
MPDIGVGIGVAGVLGLGGGLGGGLGLGLGLRSRLGLRCLGLRRLGLIDGELLRVAWLGIDIGLREDIGARRRRHHHRPGRGRQPSHQQCEAREGTDQPRGLGAAWAGAPAPRIQDREHAPLELVGLGHRQGHGRHPLVAHRGDDFEQVLGVVASASPQHEGEIVAGPLALGAQAARGRPHQRMEPVEGAGNAAHHVADQVAPLDVRQLVNQHRASPLGVPGRALGRKDDDRAEESGRERHPDLTALDEARLGVQPETIGDLVERPRPVRLLEHARPAHHPPHQPGADGETGQQHQRAE